VQKALNEMSHFEAAGAKFLMEIESFRYREEKVFAISEMPNA